MGIMIMIIIIIIVITKISISISIIMKTMMSVNGRKGPDGPNGYFSRTGFHEQCPDKAITNTRAVFILTLAKYDRAREHSTA
eukprot:7262024-Karenia_brevis.AAC.1